MRTIYKYPLKITDEQTIAAPIGTKPMCVGFQGLGPLGINRLCLWAEVDTIHDDPSDMVDYRVFVVGTGNPIPDAAQINDYIGTAIDADLGAVWHVYFRS